MVSGSMALALLGGIIGAGFASGREILRFFASHGAMAPVSMVIALFMLFALFGRLPARMEACGAASLVQLCRMQLGKRFGLLCSMLMMLLFALTGAAMLAACAELGALLLPLQNAYALSMAASVILAVLCALGGMPALALPGAMLMILLPAMLIRLLLLPPGEACFLPAMTPDLPVRALADGAAYGALSAAQLAGMLSLLAAANKKVRLRAIALFTLLFGLMLLLGTLVCLRHMPAIVHQPLPFVYLSRALGAPGFYLIALCMYAAALSTLCAMIRALMQNAPSFRRALAAALCCLFFSVPGFDLIISHGYPLLGSLCAGLLLVLCLPVCPRAVTASTSE